MKKKLSKGFKEFLIKSSIFVVLFILIQLITMGVVAKMTLPGDLKLFAMDDLAEATLFMLVIFIGLNRERILKVKSYFVGLGTRILSGISVILGFFIYFSYKKFLLDNLGLVSEYIYLFTLIEYLLLFVVLFFLVSLVFGFKFCRDSFKEYKKGLLGILIGIVFIYLLVREFQSLWVYLSGFVGSSVNYLLSLVGTSNLYYVRNLPVLAFHGFIVSIASTCSGIDSVLLFTGLYLGILAWDWKILDKKKAFGMYFVGVLGTFALNIVRIFLLILIGAYVSESFALNIFHTNASSLFFIIYFAIFWKMSYKWMKK